MRDLLLQLLHFNLEESFVKDRKFFYFPLQIEAGGGWAWPPDIKVGPDCPWQCQDHHHQGQLHQLHSNHCTSLSTTSGLGGWHRPLAGTKELRDRTESSSLSKNSGEEIDTEKTFSKHHFSRNYTLVRRNR